MSVIDEAATQFGIWCHKGSPAFAGREPQSFEAAPFAADAYHGRLRLLDTLAGETGGPFLAGALYGVPLPNDRPVLAEWYAMFGTRPSAAPVSYPAPLLTVAHGLPKVCSPSVG